MIGGTPIYNAIKQLCDNGGLIAGTSAGASVMSDTMIVQGEDDESPHKCTLKMSPGLGLVLAQTLWYSSNIGVSRIIDDHYRNNPEKFVKGIYRTGLHDDLKIPLAGATPARIRMPHRNKNGQYDNWAKTSLPWMSIGYETQVPPISTLTFYNTIANNGKMMRPRFVSKVMKNGETIMEFPPEVMRQQIAKEKSIKELQTILEQVVSVGLGKKAGSPNFKVAGKTGTAQISKGAGGYKSGGTSYLISFAGYFPADAPRYSCIVCIQKSEIRR